MAVNLALSKKKKKPALRICHPLKDVKANNFFSCACQQLFVEVSSSHKLLSNFYYATQIKHMKEKWNKKYFCFPRFNDRKSHVWLDFCYVFFFFKWKTSKRRNKSKHEPCLFAALPSVYLAAIVILFVCHSFLNLFHSLFGSGPPSPFTALLWNCCFLCWVSTETYQHASCRHRNDADNQQR